MGVKRMDGEHRYVWTGEADYYRTICCQLYSKCHIDNRIVPHVWYSLYTKYRFNEIQAFTLRCSRMPDNVFEIDFEEEEKQVIPKLAACIIALHYAARIHSLASPPTCYYESTSLNTEAMTKGIKRFFDYDYLYLKAFRNAAEFEITGPSTNTYQS